MFLEVEDGMVKTGDGHDIPEEIDLPKISKVEVGFLKELSKSWLACNPLLK